MAVYLNIAGASYKIRYIGLDHSIRTANAPTLRLEINAFDHLLLYIWQTGLFTGNQGFSTFAGVFEQRNKRIEPAVVEVPPRYFARGMQRRLPFLQDRSLTNCRYIPVYSIYAVSDAIYLKKKALLSTETSIYI